MEEEDDDDDRSLDFEAEDGTDGIFDGIADGVHLPTAAKLTRDFFSSSKSICSNASDC